MLRWGQAISKGGVGVQCDQGSLGSGACSPLGAYRVSDTSVRTPWSSAGCMQVPGAFDVCVKKAVGSFVQPRRQGARGLTGWACSWGRLYWRSSHLAHTRDRRKTSSSSCSGPPGLSPEEATTFVSLRNVEMHFLPFPQSAGGRVHLR